MHTEKKKYISDPVESRHFVKSMKIEKIKRYEAADTYALSRGFSKGENIYLQNKK